MRLNFFHDFLLGYLLGGFLSRGFQLVTDGYPMAGTDELGQIGIEGMERKACHFEGFAFGVLGLTASREGDT